MILPYIDEKNSDNMNLDLKYFDAQIIRVIFPSESIRTNTAYVYGDHTKNRKNTNQVHY